MKTLTKLFAFLMLATFVFSSCQKKRCWTFETTIETSYSGSCWRTPSTETTVSNQYCDLTENEAEEKRVNLEKSLTSTATSGGCIVYQTAKTIKR